MLRAIRKTLAVRLTLLYGGLFALVMAASFSLLYWFLANALEDKERAVVEQLGKEFEQVYRSGGPNALRSRLIELQSRSDHGGLYIRVMDTSGVVLFALVPTGWIETQVQRIPTPEGNGFNVQVQRTVRVPRDAEKDFTVATIQLNDGRLLQVAKSSDNRATLLAPLKRTFWAVAPVALFLAALGGGLAAWRITRPIRLVNQATRRILETGDLDTRIHAPGGAGDLAELVNQLNRVLTQNAALIRAQRETLDNLAHDLRTPLARLRGVAELALQNQGDPVRSTEALADCVEESERVLRLLEVMLDVSAAETGTMGLRREELDLRTLVERAVDLYSEVAEDRGVQVETRLPAEPVLVSADPTRLGQAVSNLLDNALKYTPKEGRVCLTLGRDEYSKALLEISDSGPGVAPEEREKIWGRLYRSDKSRSQRGLGLGLSLVKAIVTAHGGTIGVDASTELGGARFWVRV